MGCRFSTRTPEVLIGDLSQLPAIEQKVYSLGHAVLDPDDPRIKKTSNSIGIKILATKIDYEEKKTAENDTTHSKDNENGEIIDDSHVVLDEAKTAVKQLFSLLITVKPYWFSQTFSQWKALYGYENVFACCRPEQRAIYLVPIDNFPPFIRDFEIKLNSSSHYLNFHTVLQTFAEAFFDSDEVHLLPNVNLLESRWDIKTRVHKKTKQKQYFVKDFHQKLKKLKPKDGFCIMGYIWTDMYPTEALNFILGEAEYLSRTGIFCFGRYEPKSYDPETHTDITEVDAKLLWKIFRVFSHELGHLFGLQHCWYFHCSMNESNSMAEAYSQPLFLCPVCLRKLQHRLGFSVLHRYARLRSFLADLSEHYPSTEIQHAVNWLDLMMKYLQTDGYT